jgi:ATP phosphoribosyltransferase regulatory subunit
MPKLQNAHISGTLDYYGDQLGTLERIRLKILETFALFGYTPVEFPILQTADIFLERSGEEIRRRMYVFNDPGGRELCLRPEMTIPACRLFLQTLHQPGGVARLSYYGPAFRYESPSKGRYRQFSQAGVECLGATDAEAAEAEVVGLAVQCAHAVGVEQFRTKIGDLSLVHAFLDGLPIPERWRTRLKRHFWRPQTFRKLLEYILAEQAEPLEHGELPSPYHPLQDALTLLGPERARLAVEEVLALVDIRHIGGRGAEEIAARFVDRLSRQSEDPVSSEVIQLVEDFLSQQGEPRRCLESLREFARTAGVALDAVLDRAERRLRIMEAYGVLPGDMVLDMAFRRGIAYYSGFIFELHSESLGEASQLCGGGRYDSLLRQLGAAADVPGVGFAFGVDRLLLALALQDQEERAPRPGVAAVVAPVGNVDAALSARVAQTLRQGGWQVRLEVSEHRPKNVLRRAVREGVPYVVFVGEEETSRGCVRVKNLEKHQEFEVALEQLREFITENVFVT